MSEDQLGSFYDAIRNDDGLRDRLSQAADVDAVVAIAREAGFDIRSEQLQMQRADMQQPLSDEDLESVAGGNFYPSKHCLSVNCTGIPVICP